MNRLTFLPAAFSLCLASCQKIDFADKEKEESGESQKITILGTGDGSLTKPCTPTDIIQGPFLSAGNQPVWVIGYVVGATYRTLSAADFSQSTTYSSNILLSSDSLCTDVKRCIPVELSGSKWQDLFSLPRHPQGFRQCLLVQGIPSTYFNSNGLRKVSEGHWLYGFDLSSLDTAPQEWEIILTSSRWLR